MNAITSIQPTLALDMPEDMTLSAWQDLGRKLCSSGRAINWLIGDWLDFGMVHFPDAKEEAIAIFRADERKLDPILRTCRKFPPNRRHDALTFGHHAALLKVEDAKAAELLDEAERHRVTVHMLKAQVKVISSSKQQDMGELDDDPVDTAYRRIVHAWNNAPSAARKLFQEQIEETGLGVIEL